MDPTARHGYEEYSFHSQYNLLAASMLATAWSVCDESIPESQAPAEIGGFVFQLPTHHHKIFANCSGLYLEIETSGRINFCSTHFHITWKY